MNPAADSFAELQSLLDVLCEAEATPSEVSRLEKLVLKNSDACAYYMRYMQLHGVLHLSAMPLGAAGEHKSAPARKNVGLDPARSDPSPKVARSPVLGFLRGVLRDGGEMKVASALMWLTMALLCSGMVLSLFLCIVLVFHEAGTRNRGNSTPGTSQAAAAQASKDAISAERPTPDSTLENALAGERRGDGFHGESAEPSAAGSFGSADHAARPSLVSVARLIHANDCSWAIGSNSPNLGDDLLPGRKLVLRSGLAEVMFQSGVRAILEGPATMEIVSNRSSRLVQGKVTVRVEDPDAAGFEVHTPGMKYTDLGTEFGVSVAKDGTQLMAVFRGQVRAEQDTAISARVDSASGRGVRRAEATLLPLVLTANQAIRVSSPDPAACKNPDNSPANRLAKRIERVDVDEKLFVRASPGPEPFPIFGTGVGLDRGSADKHWEIVAVSTDPDFKPRPAWVVSAPMRSYVRDSRDDGQWVSLTPANDLYPEGCRWTFRTKFDLRGFDPKTARIEGQFAVDNFIAEVRLNGHRLPVDNLGEFSRYRTISIDRAFIAGVNTLEIVIVNGDGGAQMGLCVDWKGTARRPLLRD